MLIVRPAELKDFDDLVRLARLAGPGFTSLAVSDADLHARLEKSVASFAKKVKDPGDEAYLLMLEDTKSKEVVGISALKAHVGLKKPFFSFKLFNIIQNSNVAERRFDISVMMLVNEYTGASEVGTLFVEPKMRGTGAGRLISQARYMLIAAERERFSKTVISELRGMVDEKGYSPFWEAVGRKFFQMDFAEADSITAGSNNQFITDLMPKYPIYTILLPEDAQAVIGKTHPHGKGARKLLEEEGFRYDNCIDIFDAGPTMAAPRDQIRTVKDSHVLGTIITKGQRPTHRALLSNHKIPGFRAIFAEVSFEDMQVFVEEEILHALQLKEGEKANVFAVRKGIE